MSGTNTNDWKNWVVVHGNNQMVVDDVWGIGKTIGLMFRGDKENMFNVLSRAGEGKKGNSPHAFSYRPSVGASGGHLIIWDSLEVEVWSSESRDHVLWCHGRFITSGEEFFLANVYAPCDEGAKQGLFSFCAASITGEESGVRLR
jgi:hypothetical protein